jgi:predicted methyltransferase
MVLDYLKEKIDFALPTAVLHEVSDAASFFSEIYKAMKPTGILLVAEPKGHVSEKDFETTISIAEQNGFTATDRPQIKHSRTVLLERNT